MEKPMPLNPTPVTLDQIDTIFDAMPAEEQLMLLARLNRSFGYGSDEMHTALKTAAYEICHENDGRAEDLYPSAIYDQQARSRHWTGQRNALAYRISAVQMPWGKAA
jgi:hypothetical protein